MMSINVRTFHAENMHMYDYCANSLNTDQDINIVSFSYVFV